MAGKAISRDTAERLLGMLAALSTIVLLVLGLLVAPVDAVQGQPQRLMYVHVPAAWVGYLAFATVTAASSAYLIRRDLRWDQRAQAAAELGVGLTALAIVLGSMWGRPVWGVWWTWDPRLVSTVLLLLTYVGYLGIRGLTTDPHLNARRAAAVGIIGFANIPIVHFSVVWWRTLHQPPTVLRAGGPSAIDPSMLAALFAGAFAFAFGAGWLYLRRLRVLSWALPARVPIMETEPDTVVTVTREGPS